VIRKVIRDLLKQNPQIILGKVSDGNQLRRIHARLDVVSTNKENPLVTARAFFDVSIIH
jgi:hypothetical protein